jgi:hypothetical protein
MVAAAGADELEQAGVAAFGAAVRDAGRLAPQERRPAVAGLAGRRERRAAGPHAQPRVTAATRVRCWDSGRAGSRSGICHDVRGAMTAHSTHHQAVVLAAAGA